MTTERSGMSLDMAIDLLDASFGIKGYCNFEQAKAWSLIKSNISTVPADNLPAGWSVNEDSSTGFIEICNPKGEYVHIGYLPQGSELASRLLRELAVACITTDEEEHLSRDAVVSDESWRLVVSKVLTALDIATGDTDPNIDPDMTDDEVRDEYPEIWAMQQLSLLLANQPESLASRKVAVTDGWKLVPVEPTPKMVAATFNDAIETSGDPESHNTRNRRIYKAMISASQDEVK